LIYIPTEYEIKTMIEYALQIAEEADRKEKRQVKKALAVSKTSEKLM
jgi:hypothetical protein